MQRNAEEQNEDNR